jgi:hypothetical protein
MEAELDESVVEVGEDDFVGAACEFVVKDNGTEHAGIGVSESIDAACPTAFHLWDVKGIDGASGSVAIGGQFDGHGLEGWLSGEGESFSDDGADILGGDAGVCLGGSEACEEAVELAADIAFESEHIACGFGGLSFFFEGEVTGSIAKHHLLDLVGDDGTDFAEVLSDGIDFFDHANEEFEIIFEFAGFSADVQGASGGVESGPDEVIDLHFFGALSMSVDASISLFESIGVPWDFVMDEVGAMVLQVNPFGGGVSGEQDADFGFGG